MNSILNIVEFVIYTIVVFIILGNGLKRARVFQSVRGGGKMYMMNKNMYFVMFTVMTAPFFFPTISLAKYILYFVIGLWIVFFQNGKLKFNAVVVAYLMFFCWVVIRCANTKYPFESSMVVIKYFLPLLSFWLAYKVLNSPSDMFVFMKKATKWIVIYTFLIGGFSAVFMPWFYYSPFGWGIFLTYAGLADYFSSLFCIPLALFLITKEKKYLLAACLMVLSTILESVRTGIGAMTLGAAFLFLYRYKIKSLPIVGVIGCAFLCVILFVPEVNEKFFKEDAGEVTAGDIISDNALGLDNINTNGREFLWELTMNKFYDPSPLVGSGTGMTNQFVKERGQRLKTVTLLHSDYVQILCDNGLVGIVLLALFYMMILINVLPSTTRRNGIWIQMTGAMAVSSMAAVAFSMGFDNVVGHSMTSLINPFILLGFFYKLIDIRKRDKRIFEQQDQSTILDINIVGSTIAQ